MSPLFLYLTQFRYEKRHRRFRVEVRFSAGANESPLHEDAGHLSDSEVKSALYVERSQKLATDIDLEVLCASLDGVLAEHERFGEEPKIAPTVSAPSLSPARSGAVAKGGGSSPASLTNVCQMNQSMDLNVAHSTPADVGGTAAPAGMATDSLPSFGRSHRGSIGA